jgi:hypothetical protein
VGIAQTKGVIPRYIQMTEIWGLDPAEAERALEELEKEQKADAALGLKQAQPAEGRATAPAAGERPVQPREQGAA